MRIILQGAVPDDRLTILENESELVMERTYPAKQDWNRVLPHLHPHQDELFEVYEGMLSVRVNGIERTYVAGETFRIPRGTPHLVCNQSSKPVRVNWKVRPAMNTIDLFKITYGLRHSRRMRGYLQRAVISWAYRDIFKPLHPPLWIQPLIFAPLAFIGRSLGYQARYTG